MKAIFCVFAVLLRFNVPVNKFFSHVETESQISGYSPISASPQVVAWLETTQFQF